MTMIADFHFTDQSRSIAELYSYLEEEAKRKHRVCVCVCARALFLLVLAHVFVPRSTRHPSIILGKEIPDQQVPQEVDIRNIRKRVFTNWMNYTLRKASSATFINDICRDLQSGLALLELLKLLNTERPIPPYHTKPRNKQEMIRNHQIIFDFLLRDGVDTKLIGSKYT